MSIKSMIRRLRRVTDAKNDAALCRATGIHPSHLSKILHDKHSGDFSMSVMVRISDTANVPIGLLAEWWAEPDSSSVDEIVVVPHFPDLKEA